MQILVAFFVLILLALGLFLVKGAVLALAGLLVLVLAPFVLLAAIGSSILRDFFRLVVDGGSNRGHDYRRHHGCRCHGGRRR